MTIFIFFIFILIWGILNNPKIKGLRGERKIKYILKKLNSEYYKTINDILIQKNGYSSQIDHIVISTFGVFVIETKNYSGKIYGSENDKYWTQYLTQHTINKLYSPILQNKGHIIMLQNLLYNYNIPYFSIVVFCGNANIKKLKVQTDVVTPKKLLKTIKKYNK